MRIPRILFVVPGLLAGLLVPALQSSPKPLPAGAVGMITDDFAKDVVTIHEGQRLTLFNNSTVIHVIGTGKNGVVTGSEKNVPITGFHVMPVNSVYRTPPWKTPGTYWVTCSVHPDMTLKVIVRP
jgi:plastocyanin